MHVLLQATFHKRRSYNGRNMQICRCQALPDPLPALACLTNNEMVWGRPEVTFRLSPRWKNANKAKENFTEVKLLPTASMKLRPHACPSASPTASWRIAKKPIGQLHCRGSCLSIFISLPASLRWANCRCPPAAKWGLTRSVLYGKERTRVPGSKRSSTNPSSFNICLELKKARQHT